MAKARNVTKQSLEEEVRSALRWLKSHSTKSTLEGMARYAIPSDKAFGVAYKDMKMLGGLLGRDHELAATLWDAGVCFNLFDRTPHAWAKVTQWSSSKDEFVKRTAFALLWSLSVHDKRAGNEPFVQGLVLVERADDDERNFVKKAVNMALRAIGKRNRALNTAAVSVARRLAGSRNATARWVGKDALRELTSPAVIRRLARRLGV